jgi:hypothetical protein
MSAWTKFATNFFHQKQKQNPDFKFSQALKQASPLFKKMKKGGSSKKQRGGDKIRANPDGTTTKCIETDDDYNTTCIEEQQDEVQQDEVQQQQQPVVEDPEQKYVLTDGNFVPATTQETGMTISEIENVIENKQENYQDYVLPLENLKQSLSSTGGKKSKRKSKKAGKKSQKKQKKAKKAGSKKSKK